MPIGENEMIRKVTNNRFAESNYSRRIALAHKAAALKEAYLKSRRARLHEDDDSDAADEDEEEADVELANEGPKTIVLDGVTYDLVPHDDSADDADAGSDDDADADDSEQDEDDEVTEDDDMSESTSRQRLVARHHSMGYRR